MAGNSLRRLRSWISIAILSGCYLLPRGDCAPCTSYPSNTTWDARVTIFLRGRCDGELDVGEIEDFVQRSDFAADIIVTPTTVTCETQDRGLGYLLNVLEQGRTRALVAALDSSVCEIVVKFAGLWNVPLVTWTCPLRELSKEEEEEEEEGEEEEQQEGSSVIRLSPSFPSMANALAEMFHRLGWRTVIIVGTDREPWSSFERSLINRLRRIGIGLRYRTILPYRASPDEVRKLLRPAHGLSRKATLICLPTMDEDESIGHVLAELDGARRASNPLSNSMIVMIQPEDDDVFLPRSNLTDDSSLDTSVPVPPSGSTSSNFSTFNVTYRARWSTSSLLDDYDGEAVTEKVMRTAMEQEEGGEDDGRETRFDRRFFPSKNFSAGTLASLLAIMPFDQRYDVERLYNGTEEYARPSLLDRLNESLTILTRDNGSIDARNNKMYTYALLDWCDDVWRPIMLAIERQEELYFRKLSPNATAFRFAENSEPPECDVDVNVECEANVSRGSSLHATHIVAIVLGSLLITTLAIASAFLIRKRLLKKRMSKGPYKIILTMTDFVFPQVAQVDSKRVDEGIETMLCCWLQQLEKFGGPEVEKPDLLQLGSVGSLMPYLQAGSGNLTRHTFLKDPRARYNGDLVQLKELPCQGNFELKNKAMDVLVTIHGLRHENLNPLIGCLNEPARPYLVYEYCSRGSLEDVLVQDEIKLDWSFRLSLLTDLVRGMRYLHGTPIRVHGYLTSRNCVIDARWVLKVTDYGLPAFYEAQNVSPAAKTARDLLWTAPELLRHPNLRKKGTQPGDVYSFGIIMQEVVVRGEPFCMLALSPEDIIEKVMKPPPLIRPSVSKGAAPPEAINIMRQCWAEAADMRPDFDDVHDLFKKLNHGRKVNFVDTMFQMLEKYSNNLEELIRERTEQLDMEKKKTEQLLNRMLPSSVAEKLKLGMPVDPEEFREVTIYFSDIVGFTTISAHSTPFQVVDLLNDLYTCFDATINAYTVYKVETIGDAYMVVGGCPVRIPDHASQIATMALDLLHQSGKFKLRHLPKTQLRLRIGLHTGPCCAGVVGLTMPRYCLFGDTVNTASRMESTGAPWRIHLSQATRDRLCEAGGYRIEYRGRTDVKGKGKMPTYWLLGKQDFDKELPTPPPLGENHGLHESLIAESMVNEEPPESPERQIASTPEAAPFFSTGECDRREESGTEDDGREVRVMSQAAVAVALDDDGGGGDGGGGGGSVAAVVPPEEGETVRTTVSSSCSVKSAADPADGSSPRKTRDERLPTNGDRRSVPSAARSPSGETQASLGISSISGSCAEQIVAPSVLGASSTSLASVASSTAVPYRPGQGQGPSPVAVPGPVPVPGPGATPATASARHRRIAGFIDENDLSSPYNHYRCLSPNDQHGRSSACRLLKRQFSLDRADEPISLGFSEPQYHHQLQQQQQQQQQPQPQPQPQQQQQNLRTTPRLYKQNSAGAANDLERIEEVPSTPGHKPLLHNYRHAASVSLSVESLSLR